MSEPVPNPAPAPAVAPAGGGAAATDVGSAEAQAKDDSSRSRRGLATFGFIWGGQVVSLFGSGLSGFALGVWVYQQSGSATQFALLNFFIMLPILLVSPIAGALADRWDRKWLLVLADAGAAVSTLALLYLAWAGSLEVWHIYLAGIWGAVFGAFQMPAFLASVPLLVPKRHIGRTAGLTQLGQALPQIAAPLVAGVLMVSIGLAGVLAIDLVTFLFAVLVLLPLTIPRPPRAAREGSDGDEAEDGDGDDEESLLQSAVYGWHYLRQRPGMMSLLLLFTAVNFTLGSVQALLTPLVLSFGTAKDLGVVLSVASVGLLVGSLGMSVWGGPERRIRAILWGIMAQAVILFLAGLEPSVLLVSGAAFSFLFFLPVINSMSTAIWQTKVDPAVQGRVFSFQRLIGGATVPLAFLVAGPAADYVFEPLLAEGGAWAASVGQVVGTGPGRGIAFMFLILALISLSAVAVASRLPRLLHLEEEIPDALPDEPDDEADTPSSATSTSEDTISASA